MDDAERVLRIVTRSKVLLPLWNSYQFFEQQATLLKKVADLQFVFDPAAEKDAGEYDSGIPVSAPMYADALARLRRLVAEKRGAAR